MRPEKFGVAIDQGLAYRILEIAGVVHKRRNAVIVRMLEIAREDLAPFDDSGLRRLFAESWEKIRELPALRRQLERRSHSRLLSPTATRLTVSEKSALRELARKSKTTMSAIQRDVLQRILAAETS
jgi:hypothetical protein